MPLALAIQIADEFLGVLKRRTTAKKISTAGSLRRQKETVRDIDILAVSSKPQKIMNAFIQAPVVKEILARGKTKSSVRTKDGVQIDCRVVEEKSFGAALMYFTGSKNFNIKIRELAARRGLKVNEYGVFKKDKFMAGKTEEEIFKFLGMSYIPPELREDCGEIELAKTAGLPKLISPEDLKGDLHVHSDWSDGSNTIDEIARACCNRGYSYCLVTDHSQGLKVAGGLNRQEVKAKRREIDKINQRSKGFRILCGTEVDIDSQGALDYKDDLLKEFDIVVAAIHSGFKQSRQQLTKRLVRACQNRLVNIIAHPTGRLWGAREAYDLDLDEVFKVASETNTSLEINAFPQRMDLSDLNCRRAKDKGVRMAISTDAHNVEQLDSVKLGISVARRGWLGSSDVINTLPLEDLLKTIKK
jgi:DNA polymerase (family 10)